MSSVENKNKVSQPTSPKNKPPKRSQLWRLATPIILFAFMILAPRLINKFGGQPDPHYSFTQSPRTNIERHTEGLGVKYYVHEAELSQHPIGVELASAGGAPKARLRAFEKNVENTYRRGLYEKCRRGHEKGRGKESVGTEAVDAEAVESCEELRRLERHLEL